jgi:enoyl-CoA hydratase
MATEMIDFTVADGVAEITLDQPASRNALSETMLDAILIALRRAQTDDAVRCVVLASSHPTVFSAGGDLAGFASGKPIIDKYRGAGRFPEAFELLGSLGKPSIAKAGGHVLAGALGLVLACDLAIASESATFATPEIHVGLFPFMVAALVYRNVPRKKATELLLMGDRVDARDAERIGVVNKVVEDAALDRTVSEWAARLAEKSPVVMRLGKDALFEAQDMALSEALQFLRAQFAISFTTEDMQEGVAAFFERRQARWLGH